MTSVSSLLRQLPIICLTSQVISSCAFNDGKLTREKAKAILQLEKPAGSEVLYIALCPESQRAVKRVSTLGAVGRTHPCYKHELSKAYASLWYDKHPIFYRLTMGFSNCSTSCFKSKVTFNGGVNYNYVEKENLSAFINELDGNRVGITMYDYSIDEVTGIRQSETTNSTSDEDACDAKVDFTYKRFNFVPWGQEYLTKIKKPKAQYTACFVKYDDGWRIKT